VSEDNGFVRERRLFYKDRLSGEVFVIGFDYPSAGDDDRASYARWGIVRGEFDHVVLGISVGGEQKLLGALPCLNDDTKVR